MKKVKQILLVLMMLLVTSTALYADEGKVMLSTVVGENIENAGIRITLDSSDLDMATEFDNAFFGATSVVSISNTELDNSLNTVSGKFSVLVRRPLTSAITVTVDAYPLMNGTEYLAYTLQTPDPYNFDSGTNTLSIEDTMLSDSFLSTDTIDGILKDQTIFTYTIPEDLTKPVGTYSGDIVFTIAVD